MQAIQHYGIVISWFKDKQLGVVRDKDDTTARLLLLAADLPAGYREPKVGDEITYIAGMDDQNRPCVLSPAPVGMQAAEPFAESGATVKEGDIVRIKVSAWDIKKNGGFGIVQRACRSGVRLGPAPQPILRAARRRRTERPSETPQQRPMAADRHRHPDCRIKPSGRLKMYLFVFRRPAAECGSIERSISFCYTFRHPAFAADGGLCILRRQFFQPTDTQAAITVYPLLSRPEHEKGIPCLLHFSSPAKARRACT